MLSRILLRTLISLTLLFSFSNIGLAQRIGGTGSRGAVRVRPTTSGTSSSRTVGVKGGHAGHVSVDGYIKRDGTYVAPHHRSQPDGNFWNNWSTIGNINPDTGRPGTKTSPPVGYGSNRRIITSYRSYSPSASSLGAVPPQNSARDYESEARVRAASRLQELGIKASSQDQSLLEMLDWESRARTANRLKGLGVDVNWKEHSSIEMLDWESRIRNANRLRNLGIDVNWKEHSSIEMLDWESRIRAAERLRRKGINVNWRDYTSLQLLEMEFPRLR